MPDNIQTLDYILKKVLRHALTAYVFSYIATADIKVSLQMPINFFKLFARSGNDDIEAIGIV
jgi:hypothetical protein